MPQDYLTQLTKISRKKAQYQWALSYEIVTVILFVFACATTYMVLIKGSYYRTAIHVVPEMNNESYMGYYSSNSENSEVDSGSDLDIEEEEDNTAPRNDKNLPFCPLNERLQEQQI